MPASPEFVWFNYDIPGSSFGVGIYKAGSVVDLTKVALLNAHDSVVLAGIQGKILDMPAEDYSVCMQRVLSAFYDAAPESQTAYSAAA